METIVTAKGFVNKQGDKVQMIPAQHEHTIQEVDGLQAALDGKAPSQHSHAMSDISDLLGFLGSKANQVQNGTDGNLAGLDDRGDLTDSGYKPGDFALSGHTHTVLYEDTYADFSMSDVIGTILNAGIHHIKYMPTTNHPESYHILIVRHFVGKLTPTGSNKHNVQQCLIDKDGIQVRSRAYNDAEHTDPYNSWSNWKTLTPDVSQTVDDGDTNPVAGGAVYTALAGKMADKSIDSTPADHADNLISSKAVYDALALKADATVVNEKIGYTQYGLVIRKDTTDSTYPITDEHLQGDVSDFVLHVPVGKVVVCQISYGTQLSQLNNALCLARWSEATGSNVFIEVYLGSSLFVALLPYSGEHVIDFTSAAWTKVDLSSF